VGRLIDAVAKSAFGHWHPLRLVAHPRVVFQRPCVNLRRMAHRIPEVEHGISSENFLGSYFFHWHSWAPLARGSVRPKDCVRSNPRASTTRKGAVASKAAVICAPSKPIANPIARGNLCAGNKDLGRNAMRKMILPLAILSLSLLPTALDAELVARAGRWIVFRLGNGAACNTHILNTEGTKIEFTRVKGYDFTLLFLSNSNWKSLKKGPIRLRILFDSNIITPRPTEVAMDEDGDPRISIGLTAEEAYRLQTTVSSLIVDYNTSTIMELQLDRYSKSGLELINRCIGDSFDPFEK
jgi:hypothetical protein